MKKNCVLICVNERHLGTLLGSLLPAPPIKDILLTHCKVFYCPFEKVKWLDFSLSLSLSLSHFLSSLLGSQMHMYHGYWDNYSTKQKNNSAYGSWEVKNNISPWYQVRKINLNVGSLYIVVIWTLRLATFLFKKACIIELIVQ